MNYILKNMQEPERLDEQSEARAFSLEDELRSVKFRNGMKVLDAGCGSGVLCRYLESRPFDLFINGCDISRLSLEHCRKNSGRANTRFFEHNFVDSVHPEKFDLIVGRLVFHHLPLHAQKKAITNLRSSLNPQGELCLIDMDGLFLNLGTVNEKLLSQMEYARSKFGGNLVSARYFPSMMKESGFKRIEWRVETLDFQGEARMREVQQWRQRFESSLSFYIEIFGNEFEAKKFLRLYLEEATKPETTLFYNKFIVQGT